MKRKLVLMTSALMAITLLAGCENKHTHEWGDVSYTWAEDNSTCTALRVCKGDESHKETEIANSTYSVVTEAKCEEDGKGRYSVSFKSEAFASQSKDVVIDALEHDYQFAEFVWTEFTAQAKYVCSHDASHVQLHDATVTNEVTTQPGCETEGVRTYTASYDRHTDTKTQVIPATEHNWGEPTYVWSDDYSSCTATRVCKNDPNHKETETADSAYTEIMPATCDTDGSAVYDVAFENEAFKVQSHEITLPATEHSWGIPTYTWSNDYSSCTATRVCKKDSNHIETEKVDSTYKEITPATCEVDGKGKYTATFENTAFEAQTHEITLPATDHEWGKATYTWADDNSTCTARRVCAHDATHVDTETVNSTYKVVEEAKCEADGKGRYTADFTSEAFADQTKDITLEAIGHNLTAHDSHAEACTEAGNSAYWSCERCGKFYSDAEGKNEIENNSWIIPADGHNWGTPTYTWSNDNLSCTAERICLTNSTHKESETVEATYSIPTEPTCETAGVGRYTTNAFENAAFTVQTKDVAIPANGHKYGTPTYTWNADNSKCTAERVCLNDPTHKESETVNSVPSYKSEPTCTEGGLVTYTATFENAAFVTQVKENVAVPAKGHKYKITYTWNDDHSQCTATAVCENDSSHTLEETKTATTGGIEGTYGTVKYGNLVKFNSEVFTDQVYALYELYEIGNGYSIKGVISALKGAITIPSSFNNTPVTVIDCDAFNGDNDITSATIPSSVNEICHNAFFSCENLESVTFESGSNLKTIEPQAFGYTKIKSMFIPASVETIDVLAFSECEELASVTFESGSNLKSINDNAFFCCYTLNNLTLPASLETIGKDAFSGCVSLYELSIESGSKLKSIGDRAFSDNSFTQISLPATLEYIGNYAFGGLGDIYYSGTKEQWNAIQKGEEWCRYSNPNCIHCSDGDIYF